MNTGEYLVSKSALPSGTALSHFLAMQTGGGTTGLIFAHRLSVAIEEPRLTLVQIPKVEARASYEPPTVQQGGDDKGVFVVTHLGAMRVLTALDELTVRQSGESSVFVRDLDDGSFTVRDVAVIEMES